ncbi:ABC transporter permease [Vermiphilus pyriformis]|nr:MAG: ABC transporter permease [Vermiphilus pyriformis]
MYDPLITMLAQAYLKAHAQDKTLKIMIKIAFGSIWLGACALALVLFITRGFEQATHDKFKGIHADLIIKSPGSSLDEKEICKIIKSEFSGVKSCSPSSSSHVVIQGTNTPFEVIELTAIDPESERYTTTLLDSIIEQVPEVPIAFKNYILIGHTLARDLHIKAGDHLYLMHPEFNEHDTTDVHLAQYKVYVGAIFKTGLEEFDRHAAYCSFSLFEHVTGSADVDNLRLKIAPHTQANILIPALRNRLQLPVISWKDMYAPLVSALKLEKYVAFFIIILISLVACMNMIAVLFMTIIQKRTQIAFLRAQGMSVKRIRLIFLIISLVITSLATLFGLLTAIAIGVFLKNYHWIKLPDAYYATHLPVYIDITTVCILFTSIMILSTIITWIGTKIALDNSIAQVLRHE